jgi:hypothetical protein
MSIRRSVRFARRCYLLVLLLPGVVLAQGYAVERPWGRLPYQPAPQQADKPPERYNPWRQMRDADRLPPPAYRGEADEKAPVYPKEPDPAYRELPRSREVLRDPRAYSSPWSGQERGVPGYGYPPAYPSGAYIPAPWMAPYNGYYGPYSPYSPLPWGGAGGW